MGRVPVGNFDIFFNTVMEQHGVLLDEALRCAQRRRVDALDVLAGDLDPAKSVSQNRMSSLSSVDLPLPLRPVMPTMPCSGMCRLTSFKISLSR